MRGLWALAALVTTVDAVIEIAGDDNWGETTFHLTLCVFAWTYLAYLFHKVPYRVVLLAGVALLAGSVVSFVGW